MYIRLGLDVAFDRVFGGYYNTNVFSSSSFSNDGLSLLSSGGTSQQDREILQPYYANFDGVSQYINCGDTGNYTDNFSISFWIYYSGGTGSAHIIARRESTNQYEIYLNKDASRLHFLTPDNNIHSGTGSLLTGGWYHCVVTIDDSTVSFYINNTLKGTPASVTITEQDVITHLGTYNSGTGGYNAFGLANLKFYNKVLTSDERTTLYNQKEISTKPDNEYQLDQTTSGIAFDTGSNSRHGAIVNYASGFWAEGDFRYLSEPNNIRGYSKYLHLNGVDNYVDSGVNASLLGNIVKVRGGFIWNGSNTDSRIFSCGGLNDGGYSLFMNAAKYLIINTKEAASGSTYGAIAFNSAVISPNIYYEYEVYLDIDNSTYIINLNGIDYAPSSISESGTYGDSPRNLIFGARVGDGEGNKQSFFDGIITHGEVEINGEVIYTDKQGFKLSDVIGDESYDYIGARTATLDALGNSLQYKGKAPLNLSIKGANHVSFDGTNQSIDLGNPTDLQFTEGCIMARFKIGTQADDDSYKALVSSPNAYAIFVRNGELCSYSWGTTYGAGGLRETGISVDDDVWHNTVLNITEGADASEIFLDGESKLTFDFSVSSSTYNKKIGEHNNNYYFPGEVSDVVIMDRNATAQEIADYENFIHPTDSIRHLPLSEGDEFDIAYDIVNGGAYPIENYASGVWLQDDSGDLPSWNLLKGFSKLKEFNGASYYQYTDNYIDVSGSGVVKVGFYYTSDSSDQGLFEFKNNEAASLSGTMNFSGTSDGRVGVGLRNNASQYSSVVFTGLELGKYYEVELGFASYALTYATLNGVSGDVINSSASRHQTSAQDKITIGTCGGSVFACDSIIDYVEIVGEFKATNKGGFEDEVLDRSFSLIGDALTEIHMPSTLEGTELNGSDLTNPSVNGHNASEVHFLMPQTYEAWLSNEDNFLFDTDGSQQEIDWDSFVAEGGDVNDADVITYNLTNVAVTNIKIKNNE